MRMKKKFELDYLLLFVGGAYVAFHLYTAGVRTLPGMKQMVAHLGFALLMIFLTILIKDFKQNKSTLCKAAHGLFVLASLYGSYYAWITVDHAQGKMAGIVTTENAIVGITYLVVVLIATRIKVGNGLPVLVLVFLAYAAFGNHLPMPWGHRGYPIQRIVGNIFLGTDALWGTVLQASSVIIAVFIIFGGALQMIKGGEFIAEFAQALLGNVRGGPAKVSVMGSALFGSISGSVAANVVGTGSITIPLMKRTGFIPEYAAAVEAIASTGGQLMPPVMGATAFILADYIGISYGSLMVAALVPALLYYFQVFLQVDFRAKKLKLKPLDKSQMPVLRDTLRWGGHLFIPIVVIIYCLVWSDLSVARSAYYGIISGVLVSFLRKETRIELKKTLPILKDCAQSISMIAVSCASAGIIVGVFSLTGLGFKLSNLLIAISGNNVVVLLAITMIASLILGMGLPTSAAYIILASLVAPALEQFGIPKMAAHFFIFYFGIYANITPPVAVGLYAAIGIAETQKFWTTAKYALQLGLTGFVMPYVLMYRSGLFLQNGWQQIVPDIGLSVLTIIILNFAQAGFIRRRTICMWIRIPLYVLCFLMIGPLGGLTVNLLSAAAAIAVCLAILLFVKKDLMLTY